MMKRIRKFYFYRENAGGPGGFWLNCIGHKHYLIEYLVLFTENMQMKFLFVTLKTVHKYAGSVLLLPL